jgi:hypothetical protein
MPLLSPILLPKENKNERETKGLRGFYLVETSCGARGIIAAIDPTTLSRVQNSGSKSAPSVDCDRDFFHAVYWSDSAAPALEVEKVNVGRDGSRLSSIAETSHDALIDYMDQSPKCLIGSETRLDAAESFGVKSVPVALWQGDDPKLPWLPCHRVLRDIDWDQSGWMVCLGREHLFFHDVTAQMLNRSGGNLPFERDTAEELLQPQPGDTATVIAISKDGAWRIHSQAGWADGLLRDVHPALRETSVVQLHSIILPHGLSLSPANGSQDGRITVVHDAMHAVEALNNGAQVAYLLSPIRSAKLKELVQHGQMLPANSVALDVAALESWFDAE